MLLNVRNKCYRQDKLELQCSLHTHSLPVTTGPGQTNIHCCSSYLYISKLPTVRFDLCKSHPMSINYSNNSLCWPKLSSQSYTSPILRWTGNSPIWGQITVQTRGSSIYESPTQPTVRLNHQPSSPQRTGKTTPNLRSRTDVLQRERSTAWSIIT